MVLKAVGSALVSMRILVRGYSFLPSIWIRVQGDKTMRIQIWILPELMVEFLVKIYFV